MKNIRSTMTNLPLYTLGAIALIAATVAVFAMFSASKDTTAWLEQAKLSPADGGFSDYFGATVAMDGDTAIGGSRYHNSSGGHGSGRGAAYVFNRVDASEPKQ